MKVYNITVSFQMPNGKPYEMTAAEAEVLENEEFLALKPTLLAGLLNEVEAKAEKALSGFDKKKEF